MAERNGRDAHEPRRETAARSDHEATQDALGNRGMLALLRSGRLQRKARVSQPDDPLEHDADRAADAVMATGQPRVPDIGSVVSGGRELDESTREFMESRFGESFDDVRIHTDDRAGQVAGDLMSRAFTVGRDIVFGAGQYAPATTEGRRLIAHELAHVVQQRETTGPVGGEQDTERDARDAARQIAAGSMPAVGERAAPGSVQKDGDAREVPVTPWWITGDYTELTAGGVTVFNVSDTHSDTPVSGKAWESDAEPGVLLLSPSYPSGYKGYVVARKYWESRWKDVRLVSGPPQPKPAPAPPKPKPKTQPKPQPRPAPQPQPAAPNTEPRTAPEVKDEDLSDIPSLSTGPDKPVADQVNDALLHDPAAVPALASRMSDADLEALPPLNRALLLWNLAANPTDDRLDVETIARILDKTPDNDVTALEDQLFANNGLLLRLMAQRVKGNVDAEKLIDSLTRLWKRGELPQGPDDGKPRWMTGLMGNPVKMTRAQHDKMLEDAPALLNRKIEYLRWEIGFDDANRRWRNNPIGDAVDFWGGLKKPQTAAELMYSPEGFLGNPYRSADYAETLTAQGKFFDAGQQLKFGQALNQQLFNQWEAYRGQSIESGESLEEGIKVGAVTVIVVATAGYAAPVVFGGSVALIGGEGVTVLSAGTGVKLGATALTTGTLFVGGGALGSATRGGLDVATGRPVTSDELWKGFKTGAPAGASVGMGYGLNIVAGLGPGSPLTLGNAAKSGFLVHGPSNAAATILGGTLEGHDPGQVAAEGLRDYGFGALSGIAGTALAPVLQGKPAQTAFQVGMGGAIPAAGVWMSGGSEAEIRQALLSGAAVSFATSLVPEHSPGGPGKPRPTVFDIHDPPSSRRPGRVIYDDHGPLVDWGQAPSKETIATTIDQTLAQSKVFGKWVGQKHAAGKSAATLGVRVLSDEQYIQVRKQLLKGQTNPKTRKPFTDAEAADYARHSRGFTDSEGLITLPESKFKPGNEVHEGLHQLQSPEFRKLGRNISEGATEYFTMIVAAEKGFDRDYKTYQDLRPPIFDMAKVAGFDNVAEAYFNGDVKKVKAAFDAHRPGLFDEWTKLLRQNKVSEARELLAPYYE